MGRDEGAVWGQQRTVSPAPRRSLPGEHAMWRLETTMKPKPKYAYCESCEMYSYRIPGYRHDDGRVDSDDSPVWLLTDRETIEREGIDPDAIPTVECCDVILTVEAIAEELRAAIADPPHCSKMVEIIIFLIQVNVPDISSGESTQYTTVSG